MKTLKQCWLTFVQLIRQAGLIPQNILEAGKRRQRQAVQNRNEAERLDRILNPSKYRGK